MRWNAYKAVPPYLPSGSVGRAKTFPDLGLLGEVPQARHGKRIRGRAES